MNKKVIMNERLDNQMCSSLIRIQISKRTVNQQNQNSPEREFDFLESRINRAGNVVFDDRRAGEQMEDHRGNECNENYFRVVGKRCHLSRESK